MVVGPDQHGWCGTPAGGRGLRPCAAPRRAAGGRGPRAAEPDAAVVHLPFTERLFAPTAEAGAGAYEAVVAPALAAGVAVSVTLHDLPSGSSPLQERRRAAYDRVVARRRGGSW